MAQIEFDERTLSKAKHGIGIYKRRVADTVIKQPGFIEELRTNIFKTIEVAFREYARKHKGCTPKLENDEWKRFEKILKTKL